MRIHILIAAVAGIFLIQTACQKGVKTEHGFQFINYTNKGGVKPTYGDQVLINVATYVGDSLMGSTYKAGGPRELTLPEADKAPKKFPPVFDALLMMGKGDSATVFQTLDSAMIASLPKGLKNVKEARYTIVLVDVVSKADLAKKADAAKAEGMAVSTNIQTMVSDYKAHKLGDKLKKTESGLEYVIVEPGTGAQIKGGDRVPTNYYGVLLSDGKMFDNSYDRGAPAPFTVGQMIPGFDEGLKLLKRGGKAYFFIPASLGYGEQPAGTIPPGSSLVFYVATEAGN
jgi:FKBP-type peptidyl-prolyl cis-trans isomerase FkpA